MALLWVARKNEKLSRHSFRNMCIPYTPGDMPGIGLNSKHTGAIEMKLLPLRVYMTAWQSSIAYSPLLDCCVPAQDLN